MLDLKVAVLALLVYYLHGFSSCMAAGLRVPRGERSGVISGLLRSPKTSRSVARDLHTRQTYCPAGSYACPGGQGCCDVGYDCVVVAGQDACCPTGSTCGGTPVCQNPADRMCPSKQFCCPAGEQCFSDFTCGGSTPPPPPPPPPPATSKIPTPSPTFNTQTSSDFFSSTSTSTPLIVSTPSTLIFTPLSTPSTSSSTSTSTSTNAPNGFTSDGVLTVTNPVLVLAGVAVGLLPFIN